MPVTPPRRTSAAGFRQPTSALTTDRPIAAKPVVPAAHGSQPPSNIRRQPTVNPRRVSGPHLACVRQAPPPSGAKNAPTSRGNMPRRSGTFIQHGPNISRSALDFFRAGSVPTRRRSRSSIGRTAPEKRFRIRSAVSLTANALYRGVYKSPRPMDRGVMIVPTGFESGRPARRLAARHRSRRAPFA